MPLALLLFLICALLASVVLAASSTVGGRHSQLIESDQSYYGVASAVELFQKELTGTPVAITCELDKKVTTTTTYSGGTAHTGTPVEETTGCTVKVDGTTIFTGTTDGSWAKDGLSISEQAAAHALFGGASFNPAQPVSDGATATAGTIGEYTVNCDVDAGTSGIDASKVESALATKAYASMLEDGRLQLRFDSVNGPAATRCSLTLLLDADISVDELTEEGEATVTTTGTTRTETKQAKTVYTATVAWTPSELVRTTGGAA